MGVPLYHIIRASSLYLAGDNDRRPSPQGVSRARKRAPALRKFMPFRPCIVRGALVKNKGRVKKIESLFIF